MLFHRANQLAKNYNFLVSFSLDETQKKIKLVNRANLCKLLNENFETIRLIS